MSTAKESTESHAPTDDIYTALMRANAILRFEDIDPVTRRVFRKLHDYIADDLLTRDRPTRPQEASKQHEAKPAERIPVGV